MGSSRDDSNSSSRKVSGTGQGETSAATTRNSTSNALSPNKPERSPVPSKSSPAMVLTPRTQLLQQQALNTGDQNAYQNLPNTVNQQPSTSASLAAGELVHSTLLPTSSQQIVAPGGTSASAASGMGNSKTNPAHASQSSSKESASGQSKLSSSIGGNINSRQQYNLFAPSGVLAGESGGGAGSLFSTSYTMTPTAAGLNHAGASTASDLNLELLRFSPAKCHEIWLKENQVALATGCTSSSSATTLVTSAGAMLNKATAVVAAGGNASATAAAASSTSSQTTAQEVRQLLQLHSSSSSCSHLASTGTGTTGGSKMNTTILTQQKKSSSKQQPKLLSQVLQEVNISFSECQLVQWDAVYAVADLLESENLNFLATDNLRTFLSGQQQAASLAQHDTAASANPGAPTYTLEDFCSWYHSLAAKPYQRVAKFWRFYQEKQQAGGNNVGLINNIGGGAGTILPGGAGGATNSNLPLGGGGMLSGAGGVGGFFSSAFGGGGGGGKGGATITTTTSGPAAAAAASTNITTTTTTAPPAPGGTTTTAAAPKPPATPAAAPVPAAATPKAAPPAPSSAASSANTVVAREENKITSATAPVALISAEEGDELHDDKQPPSLGLLAVTSTSSVRDTVMVEDDEVGTMQSPEAMNLRSSVLENSDSFGESEADEHLPVINKVPSSRDTTIRDSIEG
ncbi:unnamed protein product [Amoebophrya sp. A120]|nr:unnamed protein product [Amoebophrya sp. A120]|eukprot:GSA120T00013958001.1